MSSKSRRKFKHQNYSASKLGTAKPHAAIFDSSNIARRVCHDACENLHIFSVCYILRMKITAGVKTPLVFFKQKSNFS
ncbi:hypothetical protein [Ereboglobus luteus]|uniref:hypothetical protein n=1 Tax=Ereboglobus luteus TaxID=1796921 RepID=UPI001374B174|nr:hypothetical protein [Ereboglobus luteus]